MELLPPTFEEQLKTNLPVVDEVKETYFKQDELLHVKNAIPKEKLDKEFIPAVNRLKPYIHRNYIPFHKKGGSISSFTLSQRAPELVEFYQSPSLKKFLENLTGRKLLTCPPDDPHSVALYYYTEGRC